MKNNKKRIISTCALLVFLCSLLFVGYADEICNKDKQNVYVYNTNELKSNIIFNDITTSDNEFSQLYENCLEYSKNDIKAAKTKLTLNEAGQYVDAGSTITSTENNLFVCDELYLQDAVILRFINDVGDLSVIGSKNLIEKSTDAQRIKDNITIKNNLDEIFVNDIDLKLNAINFATENEKAKNTTFSPLFISQEEYLNDLENIFINLLSSSYENIDNSLKEKINYYFVDNSYELITSNQNTLSLDKENAKCDFIKTAKSNKDSKSVDRIILQMSTIIDNKEIKTDIILKLDKNQKIYDIVIF